MGKGGVAGEEKLVGVPKFHSQGKCTILITNRLDVQCFLWTVYPNPTLKFASWDEIMDYLHGHLKYVQFT